MQEIIERAHLQNGYKYKSSLCSNKTTTAEWQITFTHEASIYVNVGEILDLVPMSHFHIDDLYKHTITYAWIDY